MIQYFYSDGISEFGPFTLNELKSKKLRPDFKIRTETVSFSATASSIPELGVLFETVNRPVHNNSFEEAQYYQTKAPQKTSKDKILIAVLIIWVISMILNSLITFLFRDNFTSGFNTQYALLGVINLLTAALPLMIALSIQNKTLKIIGIVIAVVLTLRFIFGAVQMMTFSI